MLESNFARARHQGEIETLNSSLENLKWQHKAAQLSIRKRNWVNIIVVDPQLTTYDRRRLNLFQQALFVSNLSHICFLLYRMHFSGERKIDRKHKGNLRVVLIKVYLEFSIARLLIFALIFHITHWTKSKTRDKLSIAFDFQKN